MSSQFVCSKADCTFAVTGVCLEAIENPTDLCPNISSQVVAASDGASETIAEESISAHGDTFRQFPSGLEIGLADASKLMQAKYARLIGILGQSNAGKTCLLTAIYLNLISRKLLPHCRFSNSLTLQGFEQRARHLRNWENEGLADQIVDHTVLGDSRVPAFLHLSLQVESTTKRKHDLLLPDLPGEWTTQLISNSTTARKFEFMHRADSLMFVFEAPLFAGSTTRHNAVTDAIQLLARVSDELKISTSIPFIFAVTKCDETGGVVPKHLMEVEIDAQNRGYIVTTHAIAAFSRDLTIVEHGFGIDKLVADLIKNEGRSEQVPETATRGSGRSFLRARGT